MRTPRAKAGAKAEATAKERAEGLVWEYEAVGSYWVAVGWAVVVGIVQELGKPTRAGWGWEAAERMSALIRRIVPLLEVGRALAAAGVTSCRR